MTKRAARRGKKVARGTFSEGARAERRIRRRASSSSSVFFFFSLFLSQPSFLRYLIYSWAKDSRFLSCRSISRRGQRVHACVSPPSGNDCPAVFRSPREGDTRESSLGARGTLPQPTVHFLRSRRARACRKTVFYAGRLYDDLHGDNVK